ncbi:MAG TPA: Mu-like prophage major head subunit gpT family protein, partial [Chloroflexota bacterium]|nr:Mu-like prophage major head subunit gpT family protein [Chloroflexota bacterium]
LSIPTQDSANPPERPRDFAVILIREGLSKTGRFYTRRCVEDIARAAGGLRAFADHSTPTENRERPVRSVRDVVGFYKDAAVTTDEETGLLQAEATLHLFEGAAWLADMAREALAAVPAHEVIGLSIDALCAVREDQPPGLTRRVPVCERLLELRSVDVVTRAGAGGRFLQIHESEYPSEHEPTEPTEGPHSMSTETLDPTAQTTGAALHEAERLLAELRAAQTTVQESTSAVEQQRRQLHEERLARACEASLTERLQRIALPAPVERRVREQWAYAPGRWSSADDYTRALEAAIDFEASTLGELRDLLLAGERSADSPTAASPTSPIKRMGDPRLEVTVSEADKQQLIAQIAMDRLFGLEGGEAPSGHIGSTDDGQPAEDTQWHRARQLGLLAGAPRWRGIREAYVALTGDSLVAGTVYPEGSLVREANEVTTGVLNHALLNSMTKRLVRDYRGQDQTWRKFCEVVPLENFRSQDRIRLHDFSSLSTVAEGAAYTNLAWDDSREAYAPAKRGNLVVVTREAIMNDDLRSIRKIPDKLSRAAYITINEFVYGLFTGNPTMSDGSKVFDDGVQTTHANRGTAVLSSTALQAAITSMMKQTDTAGKRLNLKPRYLLVPADLLFTALTIVNSSLTPGTSNNDANVLKGVVEPISVAQFTDATDWYLICAPRDIESIEIGFVGGKQEPELLMQDAPLLGQVFTND